MTGPAAPDHEDPGHHRPVLLTVGAALTALEGLVLVVYAALEVAHVNADRVGVAVTAALFFALVGGGLLFCAGGLARERSWARSPVVVVQLITLLTAWSFVGGETTWVAVLLATVSVAVLCCVLHPRSTAALAGDET